MRGVGFEPTRIAPKDLKTFALTTRPSSLKIQDSIETVLCFLVLLYESFLWCYSDSNRGSGRANERKFFREFKVPCPDLLDYSTRFLHIYTTPFGV